MATPPVLLSCATGVGEVRTRTTVPWAGRGSLVPAICAGLLLAQAAGAAEPGSRAPDGRFEHLSVEHGLSHGTVYSIVQDQAGFLWLGTEDGLSRYDGLSVEVIRHDPSDPNSLASSNFGEVYQDRAGIFWFGTWGGGLDRYDPATGVYRHFRHDGGDPASLSQDRIEVLLQDSAGTLWVGTEEAGLNRFDPGPETFVRYRHDGGDPRSLPSDEVRAIAEDRAGTLWVGTNGGLSRFDRATEGFESHVHDPADPASLSHDRVRGIVHSRFGFLWIGTRGGGLNRFEPATGQFRRVRPASGSPGPWIDAIACLHEDASGVLWIGTYDAGLSRFDPATGHLTTYRHDSQDPGAFASDRVETIYEDRANVLWLGTRGSGADRLDLKPAKFTSYRHQTGGAGLPAAAVRAIAGDPEAAGGDLWIGTDGGGLARLDRATGSFQHVRHDPADDGSLSDDHVWSLLVDRSGTLWVGTYTGGLNRRVAGDGGDRFEHYRHRPGDPTSLSHDRIQVIYQDRGGEVWLGTASGLNRAAPGAAGLEFESFRHHPGDPASLSDDYVVSLLEDSAGTLWIGTRHGLHAQDGERGRFRLSGGGALATDLIQVIFEDEARARVLWVGTEDSGLHRLDLATGDSRQFLIADGLPSNVIDGILQDRAARLWLSTSRGLSRFDPVRETFRNYDSSDGLDSHSFVRAACLKTRDGEMFFGGVTSLTSLVPDLVRDSPHRPPVVLTSLRVFDRDLELDGPLAALEAIELGHRQNFISLEFAALDFTAPEKNEYAYRLEGVDQDWIQAGRRSYASYAHLDPGRYVFRVKAANSDGVWNEQGRSLAILVAPPWWRSWWFRAAALGALGLSLFAVHRARIRGMRFRTLLLEERIAERERAAAEQERLIEELEIKNAEMERFTYTVSHDLKSPLVTIKGFLGFLRQDAAAGKAERMERDMAKIGAAADRMGRLLDELLELSRIGRIINPASEQSLTELAREAAEVVAGQIGERGVEVEIAGDMPVVIGDRQRLVEVLQNLIDNGVKFMAEEPSPRIEIGFRENGEETVFTVRDNGQGIDPEYQDKVFELFERLDLETDGTGIGLALVKLIVEVHGGRVWVESDGPGCGSTFCFTLPVAGREDRAPGLI